MTEAIEIELTTWLLIIALLWLNYGRLLLGITSQASYVCGCAFPVYEEKPCGCLGVNASYSASSSGSESSSSSSSSGSETSSYARLLHSSSYTNGRVLLSRRGLGAAAAATSMDMCNVVSANYTKVASQAHPSFGVATTAAADDPYGHAARTAESRCAFQGHFTDAVIFGAALMAANMTVTLLIYMSRRQLVKAAGIGSLKESDAKLAHLADEGLQRALRVKMILARRSSLTNQMKARGIDVNAPSLAAEIEEAAEQGFSSMGEDRTPRRTASTNVDEVPQEAVPRFNFDKVNMHGHSEDEHVKGPHFGTKVSFVVAR